MRKKLSLALLISAVLIGGAAFVRVRSAHTGGDTLTAIETPAGTKTTPIDNFLVTNGVATGAGTTTPPQNLTETDLISRQLVSDYLDLSASGQATDASLANLAATYGDNIANLKSAPQITLADLTLSSDSDADYRTYGGAFLSIFARYTTQMTGQFTDESDLSTPGAGLSSFSQNLSDSYAKEAAELKALKVPPSVISSHLKLVNNYLTASWAMKAIADAQKNPAEALAGIVAENDNAGAEKAILGEITAALEAHGIIIGNQ